MIYNKNGEVFFYENKTFYVGEEIYATESAYRGLIGRITEIRTGEDRETENEGPDIHCEFEEPIMTRDKQYLHDMMFGIEDPALDLVIMAPEMIIPTREIGAGMPEITVYALIEDCVIDGQRHDSVRLYTDFTHAEIMLRKSILEEKKENGCLYELSKNKGYKEEQYSETNFTGFVEYEYCENHYTINIDEVDLTLGIPFVERILNTGLEMKRREDIAEQIEPWEIPTEVKRAAVCDPSLYDRTISALGQKDGYNEAYWEAISEVAHELVEEHKKVHNILKIAKKEGKL